MSDGYASALAKRPSSEKPGSSRRDDDKDRYGDSRGDGSSRARDRGEDVNDWYGDLRGDGGNRARDRGEDGDRHQQSMMFGGGSTREKRFIPCTMRTIPHYAELLLCQIFKVSMEKVEEWCDDEYIRIDKTIDPRRNPKFVNIDPLREIVPRKDWERYEKAMRIQKNEIEAQDHMERLGLMPGRPYSDYNDAEDEYDSEDFD